MKNFIHRITLLGIVFLSIFSISSLVSPANAIQEATIEITGGKISGLFNKKTGIYSYKGIPYAAPPVGDLRWCAPHPVIPWDSVKECTSFGPSPMQNKPSPFMFWSEEFLIPEERISEDCLYLNVWTGARQSIEKRPVLVYIYGGGFQSGGTGCPIYDGEAIAKKEIVFVSINYRVGTFGFLAHPELSEEVTYGTSGNYALLDMIAALKWVKANITSFGGDPNNVTIAGQSAGAFSVSFLTASPLAKGLFHKAIAQSGGAFLNLNPRQNISRQRAEEMGIKFAEELDANTIADLRSKSAEEILHASTTFNWAIIDGYVLLESVLDTYANGRQNDVPLLAGWNQDDVVIIQTLKEREYRGMVNSRFGKLAEDFLKVYKSSSLEEIKKSQFDMNRDQIFGVQVYTWAKLQNATGNSPVYIYNFNRDLPSYNDDTQFGAFHSGEIAYAYNNLHTLDRPWRNVDFKIAGNMSDYWVNFARSGDPNNRDLPEWKKFNGEDEYVLIIDKKIKTKPLPSKEQLAFWEKYHQEIGAQK